MPKELLLMRSGNRLVPALLGLLLFLYLLNGIFYIRAQSITADEGGFMNYAIRLIKGHPERIHPTTDNSKMPVSVLNLIPRAVNGFFHPGLIKSDAGVSDIIAGRYVTLLFSLFTLLIVFRWSGELYGEYAGLFSAFLTAVCPNLLASAGLVTTDSYSALFLLATVYFLWKFCATRSLKYFVAFSVLIASSQLVKQSLFHLYIISLLLAVTKIKSFDKKKILLYILIFTGVNWLLINLGFYFRDTNTLLGDFHFTSNVFIHLQRMLPGWVPVPVPKAFVTGLDMAKYYDQIGGGQAGTSSFGNVTILGHSSTGGSFWYYYFISLFYKTPVSSLLFILASLVFVIRRRSIGNELFLLIPVVYFLLYMSFLYNTQCGIRHLIFVYPLLYILCGNIIPQLNNIYWKRTVLMLCVYLMISVLQYWRNYFPYTNEFIPDKKMAYAYVGASNLEFLQGNKFFAEYLEKHRDVKPVTSKPSAGVFLMNANDYLDVWNLHRYDWIQSFRPSGQVAYNGVLVTVTQDDIDHLKHPAQ